MVHLAELERSVARSGFRLRGAFAVDPGDGVPDFDDGREVATVVLIGNAGPDMWRSFSTQRADGCQTLDSWSKSVLDPIADSFGARVFYPFERPYMPFQRWAKRAEPVFASPLKILIHPVYGLWHGYRAAFALAQSCELDARAELSSPCESCLEKPCLTSCPVSAFVNDYYAVARCVDHVASPHGSACLQNGCLARRACPCGHAYVYEPPQARFHMQAFLAANHRGGKSEYGSEQ